MDDQKISQVFDEWLQGHSQTVEIQKMHISLKEGRLTCAIRVFEGDNYIPPSVRGCLHASVGSMEAGEALIIDEANFCVLFTYSTRLPRQKIDFIHLIDSYLEKVEHWRWVLNEYGQRDLIHVLCK